MTALDLVLDPLVLLLAAFSTGAQLAILLHVHRQDGEPFVRWAILSWLGRLAYFAVLAAAAWAPGAPRLWAAAGAVASAASSLAFAAAGATYQDPARSRRGWLISGLVVTAGLGAAAAMPAVPLRVASLALGVTEAMALALAAARFRPRRARHVRGASLLTAALVGWAAVRLAFEFPVPGPIRSLLVPAATAVLVVLMTALVVVVLRAAQQRVEFLKQFHETLTDGMDMGLALIGPDLTIQHANHWMTARFGRPLPGRRCLDTYLAQREPCEACPWDAPRLGARQHQVAGVGGRTLLLTCSPLPTPNGPPLLLELVSDVTEQEALRARVLHSEQLATIGRMASRLAHEIRNPLGVMGVHAELLSREIGARGEAAGHLDVMQREIRGMASLVEAYLRLGRLPRPTLASTDLEALVDERLAALAPELETRGILVKRERRDPLTTVRADGDQLGQVIVNLIRNAGEAMPAGGLLTVSTGRDRAGFVIEVADTGPGVRPEDVERVFDPFHTSKPGGTGLGLAVAREITQEHGGSLRCLSRPDGATFVLTLPVPEVAR